MTARELPDSSSIHTCSYYCDRPACVKAQRDQMRDAMLAESDAAQRVSEGMADDFSGDNDALAASIEALLSLDKKGALKSHGIGGLARQLLSAAYVRLPRKAALGARGKDG